MASPPVSRFTITIYFITIVIFTRYKLLILNLFYLAFLLSSRLAALSSGTV